MRLSVCALILFALSTVSGKVEPNAEFDNSIIENLFEEFQLLNVAEPSAQLIAEHPNTKGNINVVKNLVDEPSAEPTAEPTAMPTIMPSVGRYTVLIYSLQPYILFCTNSFA